MTRAKQAEQLGVSRSTIQKAVRAGIDPGDLQAMKEWLEENQDRMSGAVTSELAAAKKRKIDLECKRLEMQIDLQAGKLVDRETVCAVMNQIGRGFKEVMELLPDSLPPHLVGLEEAGMKAFLLKHVREVLITVANGDCFDLDENGMLKLER